MSMRVVDASHSILDRCAQTTDVLFWIALDFIVHLVIHASENNVEAPFDAVQLLLKQRGSRSCNACSVGLAMVEVCTTTCAIN